MNNDSGKQEEGTVAFDGAESQASSELIADSVVGCAIDRPLRLRQITDADLVRVANDNYQRGRKHGKGELADEIETLIYWLLRCYQSGHREGWEPGPSTQETMDGLLNVLANRGYDPNEDQAAQDLIAKIEKR